MRLTIFKLTILRENTPIAKIKHSRQCYLLKPVHIWLVERKIHMNLQQLVNGLLTLEGAIAAAIVDFESGMLLAHGNKQNNFDLEVVAARGSDVIRAKLSTLRMLKMNDEIHDILITLGTQYHLMCPCKNRDNTFLYLAIDRKTANLSLSRRAVFNAEKQIV